MITSFGPTKGRRVAESSWSRQRANSSPVRWSSRCIESTSGNRVQSTPCSKSMCQTRSKRSDELGRDAAQLPDIFVVVGVDDATGKSQFQECLERLLRPYRLVGIVL